MLHPYTCRPVGAAAAAVMSSAKTVLRPATGASAGPGQQAVQHIIHQTIQVLFIRSNISIVGIQKHYE